MKLRALKYLSVAIEYSVYGVILCIPVSIALVSIFSCLAVGLFFIKQALSPDFSALRANKIFFLLLLVFFICMSASLMNSGPLMAKSLKAFFLKWGRFPFILWMILDTFRDTGRIVKAVGVLLFSATVVGFSVFSQKFFGLEFLRHKPLDGNVITGPFSNQIGLASYLTCVIPIALSFSLWKWKRISVNIGFFLITLMLMIYSFWTHCRGAWIGLAAGLIWLALLINYCRLPKKIFWTLFTAGYVFCMPLITIGLFFLKKDEQRVYLLQGAWKMIMEHPFLGKGLGTFMNYCVVYDNHPWVCYAHNCFIQIWAESGVFSLLSFLVLMGYILFKFLDVIIRMPRSPDFYMLTGMSAGFLGLLAHCFFDNQLYSFQLSFLFWVVLGLTIALSSNPGARRENGL